jgi:hypothetical protein
MKDVHPRLGFWIGLSEALFVAGEELAEQTRHQLRPRRWASYATVRPGVGTPFWNVLAGSLRTELAAYGSKVRLARYLGVPRQRLHDFLTGRSRMPDAELTLRMLHWLAAKRAGRDLAM